MSIINFITSITGNQKYAGDFKSNEFKAKAHRLAVMRGRDWFDAKRSPLHD